MIVFRRALLVVAATFLAWRIVSYGISDYYLKQAVAGDADAIDRSLVWNSRQPKALVRKAQAIRDQDLAESSRLLRQSFSENPSSAFPLIALAGIAQKEGEQNQVVALVEESSRLMPANPLIQIEAGNYWAGRGDLDAAMMHWSKVLEAGGKVSEQLFPILLKLAEDPRSIGVFKSFAESPPSWWERFFGETAKHALNLETVRTLYAFRRAASDSTPPSRDERNRYIRRLRLDGKITEAYLVWINGLDEKELAHLGVLYNGGFEVESTNTGFDWHVQATDHVTAMIATTSGVEGKKALSLVFKRREEPYWHVYQPLFLDPGTYRVKGLVRVDSLRSQGGLKWIVRCLPPMSEELGESERFLGSSEWREFSFEFVVPGECIAQEIRLVSAGRRTFERKMTGGIWFDGMSMRKVVTPRPEALSSITSEIPTAQQDGSSVHGAFNVLEVTGRRAFSLGTPLIESLGGSEK